MNKQRRPQSNRPGVTDGGPRTFQSAESQNTQEAHSPSTAPSTSTSQGRAGSPQPASCPSTINHQPSTTSQLPFEPAPTESHRAFQAFLCYFDLGRNRNLAEVARRTGAALNSVKGWSGRFAWKDRVRAYNTHLLQTRIQLETAAHRDVAALWTDRAQTFKAREWAAAEKLLASAQAVLDSFAGRDPNEISLSEVSRALEVASKIGRLATGLATDHQELTGPENGPLQIEITAALNKIYGKPIPGEVLDVQASPAPQPEPLTLPAK